MPPTPAPAPPRRSDGDAGGRAQHTMGQLEPVRTEDQAPDGAPPVAGRRSKAAGESERTCALTRALLPPGELIRFVRAPDGVITPDLARRLPGRGVWISLSRDAVEKAGEQNVFARSLKQPVTVPPGLGDLVDRLLTGRCTQALALANKAGLVVAGFAKVEAAIGKGSVAALIHATEASADGAAKLDGRLLARLPRTSEDAEQASGKAPAQRPIIATDLAGRELSLALGRENVVHAALIQGGAARYFLSEVERLRRYRSSIVPAASRPPRKRPNTEQV